MEKNEGCVIGAIWLVSLGVSILSGVWAWNWIEPESFLGAIAFIIVWGILFQVVVYVIGLIAVVLGIK